MLGLRTLIFEVADLDAAKLFYAKVLGKNAYFDEPFYVGFDVAGYELGLRPREGDQQPGVGGATAYLGVHDVDAETARLVSLGATVREAPSDVGEGVRVAALVDPFGNVLGLIQNLSFAPRLVSAAADDLSPREVRHEQHVALPRAEVWKLWTSSEGITRWLVDGAKIELRPGGPYELHFMHDQPLGTRGSETCHVLSFLPERMLSFTWNAPPHLQKTRFEHTWVVVEFEVDGDGTRVRISHTGWPTSGLAQEPQWEETFAYFDRAWRGVLDALESFARTGVKS